MYDELSVINYLLSQVGAAPVSTLANPLPDLASAQLRLHESMVWVQKRGWWFNRLYQQTFTPDENGEIELPTNILKTVSSWPEAIIEKDGKAYSPIRDSFIFTEDIVFDVILFLEWDELPSSAQDAVMYRAGQAMILHELEDTNKAALLDADIQDSMLQLKKEHLELHQRNVFTARSVQRFLSRVRPYKRVGTQRNPTYPGGGL